MNDVQAVKDTLIDGVFTQETEGVEGVEGVEGREGVEGVEGREGTGGKRRQFGSVVVMLEAVLMYLDSDTVAPMLKVVLEQAQQHSRGDVTLIFSDRFPKVYEKTMESLDVQLTYDERGQVATASPTGGLETLVKEVSQERTADRSDRAVDDAERRLKGMRDEEKRQVRRVSRRLGD